MTMKKMYFAVKAAVDGLDAVGVAIRTRRRFRVIMINDQNDNLNNNKSIIGTWLSRWSSIVGNALFLYCNLNNYHISFTVL
jgi:hypothetical protein